ncbi:MAG: cyclic nucleotide-binding domain-containing protein, partial [Microcystaceae cyanobacterium]
MTYTTSPIQAFISEVHPFNQLPTEVLAKLSDQCQPVRYRLGETMLIRERIPSHLMILYRGQARLLGYNPRKGRPVTLQKLEPGAILGWASLVRGVYSETAIASTEVECLALSAKDFFTLLEKHSVLATAFREHCSLIEIFDILGAELERNADGATDLRELALQAVSDAVVVHFPPAKATQLDPNYLWFISGGSPIPNLPVGSRLIPETHQQELKRVGSGSVRLVGIPKLLFEGEEEKGKETRGQGDKEKRNEIPHASEYLPSLQSLPKAESSEPRNRNYPFVRGRGPLKATLACFQMLSRYFNVPFHQEVIRRIITNQQQNSSLCLPFAAAVADT